MPHTSTQPSSSDRALGRAHPRRLHFTPIEYVIDGLIYHDYTRDISDGGLFIITQENHRSGDQMTAIFKPPAAKLNVLCTGVIVRTTSSGVGVMFKSIWKFNQEYADDFF